MSKTKPPRTSIEINNPKDLMEFLVLKAIVHTDKNVAAFDHIFNYYKQNSPNWRYFAKDTYHRLHEKQIEEARAARSKALEEKPIHLHV